MAYSKKGYSTPEQVVSALRATKSESKRVLPDTAANMIEAFYMAADALREQEERGKAVSNADHIRAMSDEELAWELMTWCNEAYAKYIGDESHLPDTMDGILEWLKQPYKEDA